MIAFDALLWDMDGTLFNTYPPIRQAVINAFADLGIAVDPIRVARLLTDTFDDCVQTLSAEYEVDPQQVTAAYHEYAVMIRPETQPPFPGVSAVCRRMIQAGGRNLIFTHRERESLDYFLQLYNMAHLFADTLTADDGYPRKPDPTGFQTLLARNKLQPERVLAIGDRDLDIQAGIAAGTRTCYFAAPDFPGGITLPAIQPDWIVHSYAELAALLFG
ncbi:MAG: HAD family hydrolase [Anaerolineae bacterium]